MKTKMGLVCAMALLVSVSGVMANAGKAKAVAEATKANETKKSSPEFEKMKTLVGTWTGKADCGQGPVDMKISYRVIAGGNVVEERCFAGTPNEMLTMYYEKDGKLAMTHYCMFGNRPGMLLKASDEKSLKFDFDELCGINPAKESHMHSLTLTFDDADTVTMSCKAMIDGKETPVQPTVLKRAKS